MGGCEEGECKEGECKEGGCRVRGKYRKVHVTERKVCVCKLSKTLPV